MASDTNNHADESTHLLDNQHRVCEEKDPSPPLSPPSLPPPSVPLPPDTHQLTRTPWETDLTDCLGQHDHFSSTDFEICMLGCFAPCVLHGSNVERLGSVSSGPLQFGSHCMAYLGLCLLGEFLGSWHALVPFLTYHTRSHLRRRFNLEGTYESCARSFGCCQCFLEDEKLLESCEADCDLFTHMLCHQCALCQEARELRRRIPHPALSHHTAFAVSPPREQTMARDMP